MPTPAPVAAPVVKDEPGLLAALNNSFDADINKTITLTGTLVLEDSSQELKSKQNVKSVGTKFEAISEPKPAHFGQVFGIGRASASHG